MKEPIGVRTNITFNETNIANISLAHLLELMRTLRSYKKGLVVVGGWVPYLLLKQFQNPKSDFVHPGSKDIDIAVNPQVINDTQYASLVKLLGDRGYKQRENVPFSYIKKITTPSGEDEIQVDFLAPEYGGTSKSHRDQKLKDDFLARKAHGADIVFDNPIEFTLTGVLPNKAETSETFYIANIVGILTMKGYVLGQRYKEKDAYDIYSLVMHYKNGAASIAEEMRPYLNNGLVQEALQTIKTNFASTTSEGPTFVADFLHETGVAREALQAEAYAEVRRLLELLNF
jgi:hypothetical protein